jgi:hypothetical protein
MSEAAPDLWLVQYLCPARHALAASPYDRAVIAPADHEAALLTEMARVGVQPYCGICGSRELHFEHGKLPYPDWGTALEALKHAEAANVATRIAIDRARGSTN